MTTIPATTLTQQLFERGTVRRAPEFNRGLIFVIGLYCIRTGVLHRVLARISSELGEWRRRSRDDAPSR
jgi:hypothetical protein